MISFVQHLTPKSIIQGFFGSVLDGKDADYTSFGIETTDGEHFSGEVMLDGVREQGCWAFAIPGEDTIHWYVNHSRVPMHTAIHMMAHKIAHILEPREEVEDDEENAERWGRTMAAAYLSLMNLA